MTATTLPFENVTDREIVITRLIDAPRELVFKAWIEPERIDAWWGPNGFTTTTHEMDVRPGGIWRSTAHGPDGVDYHHRVVYTEVVPPERLVYVQSLDIDDDPSRFLVTVTFTLEDGKTRVTMRGLFPTVAARDEMADNGGIEGGTQTLDRLRDYVQRTR